jgi:hypothetical protein
MSTSANDTQRMSVFPEDAAQEIEQVHSRWTEFEAAGEAHSLMALCADDIELWPPTRSLCLDARQFQPGWRVEPREFIALRLPNVGSEVQTRLLT